ncbi:hypothetical protein EZV62_025288 [Acer yangbiense]|uniref:MADS-box domain-containing protein n=1 Tax=Acer yangbiense TaxID=1000413 RepID=A0A5C7GXD6_9ROSI|nr:hypothetical protein EZV62_025288 [Acer yangbiense]
MTRKNKNLAWIVNDSYRKVCCKKRRDGLSKKVSELSILCNVSAAIIIYSPDDTEPMTWPIPLEVQEILERFNNMPELERRKMLNQETYLQQRVSKLDEKFKMLQRKNNEMDGSNLMHYFDQGNSLDGLCEIELETLLWFVDKKHKEIKRNTASYEQTHVSHSSFPLAPPFPLLALTSDQDPMLVPNQMAHTNRDNTIESNDNHHGKAIPEPNWRPWFNEMMNNIDNVTISVKTDHMAEVSASYQPSVGIRNYKSNFDGSSGDETTVGLHPYRDFKVLISTSGTNIPIMPPPPPLLPYVGDNFSETNYPKGLQPYHGGFDDLEGILQNDMTIAHPPLHFEGNNNVSDIAQGLQPYKNEETGDNVSGGNLEMPSEFSRGNLATGDVGLPYDVTKQWPSDFSP